jgi:hypothetical protein
MHMHVLGLYNFAHNFHRKLLYILESNLHPFYSFRGLKIHM